MTDPIELKFYDDNNEVIASYTRSHLPFRMVRRAAEIEKTRGDGAVEGIDAIAAFLVEFFGDVFTVEELYDHTDAQEVMTCFRAIMGRIRATVKGNF